MRIGIDARFYGPVGKGLGRYTQEVVDNIIEQNRDDKSSNFTYVVFLSPANYDTLNVLEGDKVEKVKTNCPWYSVKEQIMMPYYLYKAKLDLVHIPHFNVPIFYFKKFVVTIHDLILTRYPTVRATTKSKLIYFLKNIAYHLVIKSALKRSEKIIAVSNFTKEDIIEEFDIKKDKIKVTYEGITNLSQEKDVKYLEKLELEEKSFLNKLPPNFIFYVGSAYPHKNLETLLNVFSKFKQENYPLKLVLAGKIDYFYKRLKEKAIDLKLYSKGDRENSKVIFAGHVSDKELQLLYQKAKAFIFPSLYEGFGLPPLEAISNNCLVLSSDKASLPEVIGDGAMYFDPENENDIYNKIKKIEDKELTKILKEKSTEFIKKYSWSKCASETRNIYLNSINKRSN
ncbi:MAG: glycosyltransferase family 1 protein [Patescibacteria group bacterium]|jgi:glycosyltransferase involved in cell wall biosynthesis|nr:glycosyltransferase family 1 protein [Patescibacteria group bacterium]